MEAALQDTRMKNLLADIPPNLPDELIETILTTPHVKIERIVSRGHCSPEGFWYDQDTNEWVMVLQGRACLLFEAANEEVVLGPGDYLNIPARVRHRVQWTAPHEDTVWLAVHYC